MAFDNFNKRYKDINAIYERNLTSWLWLWLPFYGLYSLSREARAKWIKDHEKQKHAP